MPWTQIATLKGADGATNLTDANINAAATTLTAFRARADPGTPLTTPGAAIGTRNGTTISELKPGRIDAVVRGVVGDGSDRTADLAALLAEARPLRQQVYIGDGIFQTSGLVLDYEADTPNAAVYGYRGAPLVGNGPRSTILVHKAGSTTPLLKIKGSAANSDTSHTGKVIGAVAEGFELRGQGMSSGNLTVLLELSIFQFAALRDMYVTQGGGDAVQLRRPVRTAGVRDDYSHGFNLENIKIFQNGGDAISTPDNHAVGAGILANVEAHSNGGYGFDLISANILMLECTAFANTLGGLRSRNSQGGSISTAEGLLSIGGRYEGNLGIEVDLQGGSQPTFMGGTIKATNVGGYDALVIGNTADPVVAATILAVSISGNGGAAGTAGQRAIRLGGFADGTTILNPRIYTDQFNLSYLSAEPMDVIANAGADTTIQIDGKWRTELRSRLTGSGQLAFTSQLFSQAFRKYGLYADGTEELGSGSAAPDMTRGRCVGTPEGVITAGPGSIRQSTDGNVYRKSSGTGNAGWVAM